MGVQKGQTEMGNAFTYSINGQPSGSLEAVVRFIGKEELDQAGGAWIRPEIDEALRRAAGKGNFKGETAETIVFPTLGLHAAEHIVFAGYGAADEADDIRLAASAAAKALKSIKAKDVQIICSAEKVGHLGAARFGQALAEGLLLALHERLPLMREEVKRHVLESVSISLDGAADESLASELGTGFARGLAYADGVAYARDLTNMPANELTPERLAFFAEELAREYDLDVEIIDEWSAAEQGMGGLLAVGKGSVNEPRMIVLHYEGAPGSKETWGLVGKGITFDTGGISLKRAAGMEEMISDMGGAAAVLGAMRIVGELKPEANIVAVIPTAENMPSHRAFKPGDVIRMMNGLTVEIVNTDAEGRLVLADGLTTAIRRGATRLVDVATLTGAVVSALGDHVTGAVAYDGELLREVIAAGEKAGERIWAFPTYPEYRKQLRSDAADMKNKGGSYGAAIIAGVFIGEFAEGLPWVHLDIAGTAFIEKPRSWEPKGATGVMVRTLAELVDRE